MKRKQIHKEDKEMERLEGKNPLNSVEQAKKQKSLDNAIIEESDADWKIKIFSQKRGKEKVYHVLFIFYFLFPDKLESMLGNYQKKL